MELMHHLHIKEKPKNVFRANIYLYGTNSAISLWLFYLGIGKIINEDLSLFSKEVSLLLALGVFILFFVSSCFSRLELSNDRIKKVTYFPVKSQTVIPFTKIKNVFRSFWFSYIYTIEFEEDGKTLWLHTTMFLRSRDILRLIYTKVDKSLFEDDVVKALRLDNPNK